MIAAGIGCRKGCAGADVVSALQAALQRAGRALSDVAALYAPEFKALEPELARVAQQLAKPLVFVSTADLQQQAAFALTRSAHVTQRFDLPSIAETAALAGASNSVAGRAARLLGPREISGDATCALAESAESDSGAAR